MTDDGCPREDCPGDDRLLAMLSNEQLPSEVALTISQCDTCQNRLQRLGRELKSLRRASQDTVSCRLRDIAERQRPGDVDADFIGKYRVISRIGQGGQGTVYRVLHPKLETEMVAKVATRHHGDGLKSALAHEARLLCQLQHENIARVFDLDTVDGRPFVVMEFIRGKPLSYFVRDQRPEARAMAGILGKVARALAAAHELGVVHQDIKPANIMVDATGDPKVIDFGVARVSTAGSDTYLGGTPAYMSPEQAAADAETVGPATDIFCLGAVLYWYLTGRAPYPQQGLSLAEALERPKRCEFDRELLPRAPRRLRAICVKAMSKASDERYASATAMAGALEGYADPGRRRLAVAVAVCFLVGLLALALQSGDSNQFAVDGAPRIEVARRGVRLELIEAIPLTNEDALRIECVIPSGIAATMFWLDSHGQLQEVTEIAARPEKSTLVYPPRDEGRLAGLSGPPGTEMVLICGRRGSTPKKSELAGILRETERLPQLPAGTLLRLSRLRLQAKARGKEDDRSLDLMDARKDELTQAEAHMEKMRAQLAEHFDFISAVAFRHD